MRCFEAGARCTRQSSHGSQGHHMVLGRACSEGSIVTGRPVRTGSHPTQDRSLVSRPWFLADSRHTLAWTLVPLAGSRPKLAARIAGGGAACFPGGREVPAGSGTLRPSFPSRTCPGQRGQETAHSCSDAHGNVSEPGLCLAAGGSAGGRWSSSPGRRGPSPSSGRCGETPRARQVADTGAGAGGRGPGAGVARPGSGARLTVVTRKQHPRVPGAVRGSPWSP